MTTTANDALLDEIRKRLGSKWLGHFKLEAVTRDAHDLLALLDARDAEHAAAVEALEREQVAHVNIIEAKLGETAVSLAQARRFHTDEFKDREAAQAEVASLRASLEAARGALERIGRTYESERPGGGTRCRTCCRPVPDCDSRPMHGSMAGEAKCNGGIARAALSTHSGEPTE